MLDELRHHLRAIERPAALEESTAVLPLGVPEIDRVLGGGVLRGALHEIAAVSEVHLPAASGFVVGLARAVSERKIVWIAEDMGLAENGRLYGPGLDGCGLLPERMLAVAVAHRRDLVWAMEEALRCRSVGLIIGEMRAGALDHVAVRRLSLAAAESGALGLLLRTAPPDDASTAATRWIVEAAPMPQPPLIPAQAGIQNGFSIRQGRTGPPPEPVLGPAESWTPVRGRAGDSVETTSAFTARLTRNRRGPLGSWLLTWSDGHGFKLAAHSQPVAAPLRDRSHRAVA